MPRKPQPRQRAPRGSVEAFSSVCLSHASATKVRQLVAAMRQASLPRANPSGALDMLVSDPEGAERLLTDTVDKGAAV